MALHAERILIIRPSALGDVARSVPVLVSLRRALPQARIDWLVQDSFAPVIASHPALTNVVEFPRKRFGRWARTLNVPALLRYSRPLREAKYDLVLDCQGLARSAILGWCTRSRRRVGHKQARELAPFLYTQRVDSPIERHTVDRMLDLVESLGIPADRTQAGLRLYAPESAQSWWAADPVGGQTLATSGKPGRYVVLAPTSRWISKQWPADRFALLAETLAARGLNVVLVGGSNERDQIEPLLALATRNPRVIDRVGQTDIPKLMAILQRAALVVANDSAALHIAVGFARPVVALYGPTRVHRVGPYGRDADVIQHITASDRLEHKDASTRVLMDRISVDEVIARCDHVT
jgi:lipopolysaccharide heptosyltransferase I